MTKQNNEMTPSVVAYELGRVLPQLTAINHAVRTTMRNIQSGIDNKDEEFSSLDTINAELDSSEQLELIANDLYQYLSDLLLAMENSEAAFRTERGNNDMQGK